MLMRRRGVHSGLVVKVRKLLKVFETELFLFLCAFVRLDFCYLIQHDFQNRSINNKAK